MSNQFQVMMAIGYCRGRESSFANGRCLAGNVRIVHLHEVNIHEERLYHPCMSLELSNRRIGLAGHRTQEDNR